MVESFASYTALRLAVLKYDDCQIKKSIYWFSHSYCFPDIVMLSLSFATYFFFGLFYEKYCNGEAEL